MRYCTRCKKIYVTENENEKCIVCGKKTINDPNYYSPVKIITANGFELERICAALDSEGIPYNYQQVRKDTGIQILNSAPPENCDLFVPLSAYEKAQDILVGIGAINEEDLSEIDENSKNQLKNAQKKADEEELTPRKASLVRFFSAIAFLVIIAGVVFFADFLVELVKKLFGA